MNSLRPFRYLLVEDKGEILRVTINRPGDRNSIHSPLMAELDEFYQFAEETKARAIVFTGAGSDYFIGGADGMEMMKLGSGGAHAFSVRIQALFNRMEQSPLINVAAINGLCFGGGYEFALACDLRVAVETARIGLPEVKVGLIPGGGGTQRLTRLVGMGRALRMILSGKLHRGPEAVELGLIHLCVAEGCLEEGIQELLTPILRQPPYVLPLAKGAVYASGHGSMASGLLVESERFSRCFERGFFRDLMKKQLKDGSLKTTEHPGKEAGERSENEGPRDCG